MRSSLLESEITSAPDVAQRQGAALVKHCDASGMPAPSAMVDIQGDPVTVMVEVARTVTRVTSRLEDFDRFIALLGDTLEDFTANMNGADMISCKLLYQTNPDDVSDTVKNGEMRRMIAFTESGQIIDSGNQGRHRDLTMGSGGYKVDDSELFMALNNTRHIMFELLAKAGIDDRQADQSQSMGFQDIGALGQVAQQMASDPAALRDVIVLSAEQNLSLPNGPEKTAQIVRDIVAQLADKSVIPAVMADAVVQSLSVPAADIAAPVAAAQQTASTPVAIAAEPVGAAPATPDAIVIDTPSADGPTPAANDTAPAQKETPATLSVEAARPDGAHDVAAPETPVQSALAQEAPAAPTVDQTVTAQPALSSETAAAPVADAPAAQAAAQAPIAVAADAPQAGTTTQAAIDTAVPAQPAAPTVVGQAQDRPPVAAPGLAETIVAAVMPQAADVKAPPVAHNDGAQAAPAATTPAQPAVAKISNETMAAPQTSNETMSAPRAAEAVTATAAATVTAPVASVSVAAPATPSVATVRPDFIAVTVSAPQPAAPAIQARAEATPQAPATKVETQTVSRSVEAKGIAEAIVNSVMPQAADVKSTPAPATNDTTAPAATVTQPAQQNAQTVQPAPVQNAGQPSAPTAPRAAEPASPAAKAQAQAQTQTQAQAPAQAVPTAAGVTAAQPAAATPPPAATTATTATTTQQQTTPSATAATAATAPASPAAAAPSGTAATAPAAAPTTGTATATASPAPAEASAPGGETRNAEAPAQRAETRTAEAPTYDEVRQRGNGPQTAANDDRTTTTPQQDNTTARQPDRQAPGVDETVRTQPDNRDTRTDHQGPETITPTNQGPKDPKDASPIKNKCDGCNGEKGCCPQFNEVVLPTRTAAQQANFDARKEAAEARFKAAMENAGPAAPRR